MSPKLLCQSVKKLSLFSKIVSTSVTSQPCSVRSRMFVQPSSVNVLGSLEGSLLRGHPFRLRLTLACSFLFVAALFGLCIALGHVIIGTKAHSKRVANYQVPHPACISGMNVRQEITIDCSFQSKCARLQHAAHLLTTQCVMPVKSTTVVQSDQEAGLRKPGGTVITGGYTKM